MTAPATGETARRVPGTIVRLRFRTLLVTALCALASEASAQSPAPHPTHAPALVHFGKWAVLGAAAGFTILGVRRHDQADRDYASLLRYCSGAVPCPVGPDGRYTNATAEAIFQRVRTGDRAARAWLIGGQAALVAGAVLVVMELRRPKEPENIPFAPYVVAGSFGTLVGLQVGLR